MEFYPIDFAFHIINILAFFLIVRSLAYKPIRKFMLEREARIKAQLDDAGAAKVQAEQMRAEYEDHLAAAEADCERFKEEKHEEAIQESMSIVVAARDEADRIVSKAVMEAEEQAGIAMNKARTALAATAVDLAGKVLCFNEAARTNAMAMNTRLEGRASGTVRYCGELDSSESADIRTCLQNLTGRHLDLDFVRDDSLLGGFVGFIDGQVYDFSYLAQLHKARSVVS